MPKFDPQLNYGPSNNRSRRKRVKFPALSEQFYLISSRDYNESKQVNTSSSFFWGDIDYYKTTPTRKSSYGLLWLKNIMAQRYDLICSIESLDINTDEFQVNIEIADELLRDTLFFLSSSPLPYEYIVDTCHQNIIDTEIDETIDYNKTHDEIFNRKAEINK